MERALIMKARKMRLTLFFLLLAACVTQSAPLGNDSGSRAPLQPYFLWQLPQLEAEQITVNTKVSTELVSLVDVEEETSSNFQAASNQKLYSSLGAVGTSPLLPLATPPPQKKQPDVVELEMTGRTIAAIVESAVEAVAETLKNARPAETIVRAQ